jgi:hypothetical protein
LLPDLVVVGSDFLHVIFAHRAVAAGDGVLRRPLEYRQVLGELRGRTDELSPGRPRADDADPLTFKLEILRPGTGVDQGATKGVAALDVGQVDLRQQAQSAHDIAGGDSLAVAGRDGPTVAGIVEYQGFDGGVELDVLSQIMALDHGLQVGRMSGWFQ